MCSKRGGPIFNFINNVHSHFENFCMFSLACYWHNAILSKLRWCYKYIVNDCNYVLNEYPKKFLNIWTSLKLKYSAIAPLHTRNFKMHFKSNWNS